MKGRLVPGLILLACMLSLISLASGQTSLSISELGSALNTPGWQASEIILYEIRLPRTLIALIVGASLGICGAAVQGLLHNPLASPDLTGASSGGALGAVVMLYFGIASLYGVILGGMAGSLIATWLVYRLARADAEGFTLILAGVAISSFTVAMISLLLNLAPNPYAVQEIVVWMLGSLEDLGMRELQLLLPVSLVAWWLLSRVGRSLDILTMGRETASSMGVDLAGLQRRIFAASSLAVGAGVAVAGSIGFVGLVAPHLLRPVVGWMPGALLLPSALAGACMVLTADIIVRTLPAGMDLKIGVITSLTGAPFFLHLILRLRSRRQ